MAQLAVRGGEPVRGKPFPRWPVHDQRELQALNEVLESGRWWSGAGSKSARFAREFAAFHDARYGLALTNGSHSLEVALAALGIGPGDEVIVPAYTFIATVTAVLQANAIPVLVDVDPSTYCLDVAKARAAVTEFTKAVIPVHIAGHAADMDEVTALAREHKLAVLEDAAHAHGAEWKGRKVGAIGDIGSFSFQASKTITAGEGGALITNDNELWNRCYSVSNCGRVQGKDFYDHYEYGSNYRMTEFQAALLLVQLERLVEQGARRNENGLYLNEKLAEVRGITPQRRDPRVTVQGYYLYMFHYDKSAFNGLSRNDFVKAINAEGIPTQDTYPAVHKTTAFREGRFRPKGCPFRCAHYGGSVQGGFGDLRLENAERVSDETVCLPQFVLLGEERDMDDIVEAVAKVQELS